MAKNAEIKNGRIYKLDKRNAGKLLAKKLKKIFQYNKIRRNILRKKYRMTLDALHVEFTSSCNLHCRMCPIGMGLDTVKRGLMEPALFKKIINYITDTPDIYVESVFLWQGGENLLHPKLKEMLYFLGSVKKNCRKPLKTCFLTNVTLLTKEKAEYILDSDSIDEFYFSIDCGNKKGFEEARKGAIWEDVIKKANDFVDLKNQKKKKITTGIFCITSLDDKNLVFSEDFLDLVRKIDYFHPREAHNWDGSQDSLDLGKYAASDTKPKRGLCGRIESVMAVLSNGLVVPCCQDLLGKGVMGDLNKETLAEVYAGAKRNEMIGLLKNNMRDKVELCKNCAL
jgi:sulfatase maturation enzyme AslB (radical SAM superfamily)